MADLRAYQPSFTAGELSPALWARVDLAKYSTGLKTAVNIFIHAHGGASNRPGLEFVREIKNSADGARLIAFQFNTEQSYVLEVGTGYARVFRDGGVILAGASPYEFTVPYTSADLENLTFIQEADVMYICHVLYAPRKLSRLADDNWVMSEVTFAPQISPPTGLVGSASFKFRGGDTGQWGFRVTSVSSTGAESAASAQSNIVTFQWENDDGRYMRVTWDPVPNAVSYKVYRSAADNLGFLGETFQPEIEFPSGPANGDGSAIPGSSASGSPAVPTGAVASVLIGREIQYAVSAVKSDSGEESLPSAPITLRNDMRFVGNRNNLSWDAVAGASAYIVYKESNGSFGYIGRTDGTSFTDENITADVSDAPQTARNPFSGAGNYPRCAAFVDQRLAFASSVNEPQAVWTSQSANYENFGVASPAKENDAITFRLRARQVQEIRSMIGFRGLMLLASGGEFIATGTDGEYLTPNVKITPQGYRGSSTVQPVIVGNTILFAQDRGGVVRDFSYEFQEDSFVGKDLTILSRHMFEGKNIKQWGYAQAPNSIVWVILDDGSLVSLTYLKEHDVWGWTRHETDGVFEDIVVIAEGVEDVPYFIVRREIDGVQRRYIERLHTREFDTVVDAFFVDSGLSYEGAPISVVTLAHLRGKPIVALVDGNVVTGLTADAVTGQVTLPNAGSVIHAGLAYTAEMETLDLDLGQVVGLGSVQGRWKSVSEATLRVEKTRGIWTGPTRDNLVEYKQRATEAWDEAISAFTGDITITPMWDWTKGGTTWVCQFDPLPVTVLALMPDVTVGR
jgi:hypothetical protein